MSKPPKIKIAQFVSDLPVYITNSATLGDIAASVNTLIDQFGESARYEFDSGYNNIDESLWFDREETDEEHEHRIAFEEQNRQDHERAAMQKEAKERQLLKELQAKYGTE